MGSPPPIRKNRFFSLETVDDTLIVTFLDWKILSEEAVQEIGDALYELVEDCLKPHLLLNFANVQYLGSAATGKLINSKKKCHKKNIQLCLCSIHPDLLEVF